MWQYFTDIIVFLGQNKDGFNVVIEILKVIGIVIVFCIGGRLSYFALSRELRFNRIKELIQEQQEAKKLINNEAIRLKLFFESELIKLTNEKIISIPFLNRIRKKLATLFELGNKCTVELANQSYLLNHLVFF